MCAQNVCEDWHRAEARVNCVSHTVVENLNLLSKGTRVGGP
jgi:hypothetical protein